MKNYAFIQKPIEKVKVFKHETKTANFRVIYCFL